MFNWLRDDRESESLHDRSIEQDIQEAEMSPLFDIPFADHTDRRPDPPAINGRIPDEIRVNEMTGEVTAVEKETQPNTRQSRRQNADLREGAHDMGWDFDLDIVDDEFRL